MNKQILNLLISIIPSGIASGITIIFIPWFFTDSINMSSKFNLWLSIITFLGLFWGLYCGVVIDTINRKKILLNINLLMFFIFLFIGLFCQFFESFNYEIIFLGFSSVIFYYTIFFPNLYAIAQDISKKKNYVKINSLIEVLSQTISIIAAILCGLLISGSESFLGYFGISNDFISKWSISNIFFLNSSLYFLSFILARKIDLTNTVKKKSIQSTKILQEINKSLSFLVKKKEILIFGICSQIIFAFLLVELFTLLPLFVKNCLNESLVIFSFADVTYCLGAVVAGIITYSILKKLNHLDYVIILIIITGFAFLFMIKYQSLKIFFICSLIIGITNASTRITRMTYFFNKIPNRLIGRTNTVFNTINTLIRSVLIAIFSHYWFSKGENVIVAYEIGVVVLIIFAIPLIFMQILKLTKNNSLSL